jgi:hypothetical protein
MKPSMSSDKDHLASRSMYSSPMVSVVYIYTVKLTTFSYCYFCCILTVYSCKYFPPCFVQYRKLCVSFVHHKLKCGRARSDLTFKFGVNFSGL